METISITVLENGQVDGKLMHEVDMKDDTVPHDTPSEDTLLENSSEELVGEQSPQNSSMQHDEDADKQDIFHHEFTLDSFLITKLLMKTDLPQSASTVSFLQFLRV
jgi:hypothetical protein